MNYELLSYLLKASLVLAILTLAYAWLVKRETFVQVNRWLLWMNVAATVLLPIVPVPDFEWMPDAPAKVVAEVIPAVPPKAELASIPEKAAAVSTPVTVAAEAVQTTAPWSVWDWISRVYAVVMAVLTIKLLIQLFSLWRLKSGGTTYATDEGVRLVESDKITSPFSFFHWIFYNPTQHSDDEWQQVWAHECVHAQQRHSLDMLTAEVLKIVFWFNPFAWWHQRLVQETLEFITDRAVLDSGVEKKSYQYHLLRSTLSADNEAFTNHFNKSLLKNRIAMMNKAKSSWKALGKYGVFIGMLWVCAAFTKPYRAEVAAKIVEKVPELEAVLQPKVIEKPALNDFVWEKPQFAPSKQDSTKETIISTNAVAEADTQQWVSSTKYVVYKGNYLHFLITAKTTFEDLVKIRQELDQHGLGLEVMAWQMDSLGRYLRKAQILLKAPSGPPKLMSRGIDTSYEPISPIAVTIQLKPLYFTDGTISMKSFNNASQESSLIQLAIADSEFADFDVRWAQSVAEIVERNRRKGIYFVPFTFFPAKSLQKEDTPQFSRAFAIMTNKEQKEVLKVNSSLKNAKFRLNDNPALLVDIERIPPEKFVKAVKYEVDDKKTNFHEIYMLVYTKP